MTKQFDEDYPVKSVTRKRNPNKRHKTGFNEGQDVLVQRHTRINFKNYLRNMKEQELIDDLEDFDDEEL